MSSHEGFEKAVQLAYVQSYVSFLIILDFLKPVTAAEGSACTLYLPLKQEESGVCKCHRFKNEE